MSESKRAERRQLAAKDKGPEWRHQKLRKCAGLLDYHRWLAERLAVAKRVEAKYTIGTWKAQLKLNAGILRAKIFRGK